MISEMANVVAECVKNPMKPSMWVAELGRYVCPDSPDGQRALAEVRRTRPSTPSPLSQRPPRIDPQFKLVFITAAVGTLLFIVICVALHVYTDGEPPPALAKLVEGLLDMEKIGFGAGRADDAQGSVLGRHDRVGRRSMHAGSHLESESTPATGGERRPSASRTTCHRVLRCSRVCPRLWRG